MNNKSEKEPLLHYVVVFHKIKSLDNGLSQEDCEKICSSFKFSKRGEEYFFDKNANPQYSNHVVRALMTLRNDQILEVDNVTTKFTVKDKTYNVISWLSSVTYLNPFQVKGVFVNEYYRAAYSVFSDDPDDIERTIEQES